MDRAILQHAFKRDEIPTWDCPECGATALSTIEGSFSPTYRYAIDTSHPDFDPDWITYVFTSTLECAVPSCKHRVACAGKGGVEQEYLDDGSGGSGWFDYFRPTHFEPALKIFAAPDGTPYWVEEALKESFSLFFSSPRAALNALRLALEVLLDEMDVPSINANGKYIPLDGRIDELGTKYKEIVLPAKAIKWLGNDGSHSGARIRSNHVLDGYDIFEHVLEQLYPKSNATMEALVTKINADKGIKK